MNCSKKTARLHIDWESNWDKTFKITVTPEGAADKKVPEGTVSIVTPLNGDAWTQWPEADHEIIENFRKNWSSIQKKLADYKYKQIIRSMEK